MTTSEIAAHQPARTMELHIPINAILQTSDPVTLRRMGYDLAMQELLIRAEVEQRLKKAGFCTSNTELVLLERLAEAARLTSSAAYLRARDCWTSTEVKTERELLARQEAHTLIRKGEARFEDILSWRLTPNDWASLSLGREVWTSVYIPHSEAELWLGFPSPRGEMAYFRID